ncbi:hypothetical protein [Pediococcus pentosaceus]|uniref:hypothetical protein n=1 Tax=Pediococcus pentosaceus TaxID=1255 RepID=UPI003981F0F6
MIYLTHGVKQRQYTPVQGGDWQHFIQSVNQPVSLDIPADKIKEYKQNSAPYVVYGTSTSLERGNSDITQRSVMFIDVDDNGKSYDETANHLASFLGAFAYAYAIYPTIRNNIETGARLRVAIPLDVPLSASDYVKVWTVLTVSTHLTADPAGAQRSFKQLQGLYVLTTQNRQNRPIVEPDGKPLPTSVFLNEYAKRPNKYQQKAKPRGHADNASQVVAGVPKWAETNKLMLRTLLDPETAFVLFDGWDNMLTSLGGWAFRNTYGDIKLTADIVQAVNDAGSDPIPFEELSKKFKTWAKHWYY